jgi:hypothetical protein
METRATQLAKAYKLAKAFAKTQGFEDAKYLTEWNGYFVFSQRPKEDLGCSGYPFYIIASTEQARWTMPEEALDMIGTSNDYDDEELLL